MSEDTPGWLARHGPDRIRLRLARHITAVRAKFRREPEAPAGLPGKRRGDGLVRWCTVAAVVAVAGVAAYISYWHAVEVVTHHGEQAVRGHLYPVVIDGIIVAASMVVLDAARHREAAPRLAWTLLMSGIGVTLAANVTAGLADGLAGALWSAWPALAFVGCFELLMMLVRAAARRTETSGVPAPAHDDAGTKLLPEPDPVIGKEPPARRDRGPAPAVDEDALLEELLAAGTLPPVYRTWSFEKTGMYRSAKTQRVYDEAKARLEPEPDRAAMNGAAHE